MIVTVKQCGGKITVDVSESDCPFYTCFSPHKYQHRTYNKTEGSMTSTDNYFSCSHRNDHGCPEKKLKRKGGLK